MPTRYFSQLTVRLANEQKIQDNILKSAGHPVPARDMKPTEVQKLLGTAPRVTIKQVNAQLIQEAILRRAGRTPLR